MRASVYVRLSDYMKGQDKAMSAWIEGVITEALDKAGAPDVPADEAKRRVRERVERRRRAEPTIAIPEGEAVCAEPPDPANFFSY